MDPWIALGWTVFTAMIGASLAFRGHSTRIRLALSAIALCALTTALSPLVGSTLKPSFQDPEGSIRNVLEKMLVAAWWLLLARTLIAAGRASLGASHQHSARLAVDLAAGAIYLGAVLAVVDLVFGVSVTGLVATSGVIAIVLGLALQNTLGDLFSGLALGVDRPFVVGDLVAIEGAAEGRIIETNWRSTRIATAADDMATVPNSVVAKARIVNRSAPTETHLAIVKVVLDPNVLPERAIAILNASALNTAWISNDVPCSIACTDLRGDGATYEIQFSIHVRDFREARSDLLQQIARHTRSNGIALAPQHATDLKAVAVPDLESLIEANPVLGAFSPEDRKALAPLVLRHEGDAGARLFVQGGNLASMFLILLGTFEVTRDDGRGTRRLGTIGPGDYVGELALLTGNANSATVTALTPFLAFEVPKAAIASFLDAEPKALRVLEAAAARVQARLERSLVAEAGSDLIEAKHLRDRIRSFFNLRSWDDR